jgi:hypothetical protein
MYGLVPLAAGPGVLGPGAFDACARFVKAEVDGASKDKDCKYFEDGCADGHVLPPHAAYHMATET